MEPKAESSRWKDVLAWSGVYALNFLILLPLGFAAAKNRATHGMLAAIVLCWAIGLVIFLKSKPLKRVFFFGSIWLALSQVFVVPQFLAGVFGLSTWERLTGSDLLTKGLTKGIDGFSVTMLTAIPLFTAAWFFGGGLRLLLRGPNVQQQDAADYDEASALPIHEAQTHWPPVIGQPPPPSSG